MADLKPLQTVIAWLLADPNVAAVCADRVSPTVDPTLGFPALQTLVNVMPANTGQGEARDGTWRVTIYCVGGKENDTPNRAEAWRAADAVLHAVRKIPTKPFEAYNTRIVSARTTGANDVWASDTGYGQVVITLTLLTYPFP